MAETFTASPSLAGDQATWKQADKRRFQNIFRKQAIRSYLLLSFGMGIVALALPILLVLFGGYEDHFSISYFYYVNDTTRNILVGGLWAQGIFLFLFHGLSRLENWILNVAGVAAISVAMNPMTLFGAEGSSAIDRQCSREGQAYDLSLHTASAIVFFACLAVVAVVLAKGRVKAITDPVKRQLFKRAYDIAGIAMIAMPAAVTAHNLFSGGGCQSHWIFWVECFGIGAFAFFWFVKTFEYRLLLRLR